MPDILRQTNEYKIKHKKRRRRLQIVSALASIVVFCTVYALILPAITMAKDPICGFEEHTHDDSCYEKRLVCEISNDDPNESESQLIDPVSLESESFQNNNDTNDFFLPAPDSDVNEGSIATDGVIIGEPSSESTTETTSESDSQAATTVERDVQPVASPETDLQTETAPQKNENDASEHSHTEECYEKVLTCKKFEHAHEKSCYLKKNASDADGNFSVNGQKINNKYEWNDEDGLLSFDVTLHGDASFSEEIKDGEEPELVVDINNENIEDNTQNANEDVESQQLMNFKLRLKTGDCEIDLSKCMADTTITVGRELIDAVSPMNADSESVSKNEEFLLSVIDEERSEIAVSNVEEASDAVLTFSMRAGETDTLALTANPTFIIQHYLSDFPQIKISDTDEGLPFVNTSRHIPNNVFETYYDPVLEENLQLKNGTGKYNTPNIDNNGKKLGDIFKVALTGGDPNTSKGPFEPVVEPVSKKLFIDEFTKYQLNPQIGYMNRLYKGLDVGEYNPNYYVDRIEIYQPLSPDDPTKNFDIRVPNETNTQSDAQSDFNQNFNSQHYDMDSAPDSEKPYTYAITDISKVTLEDGTIRPNLESVRFTNNPSNTHISEVDAATKTLKKTSATANPDYPYEYTVLIKKNTVIRFVLKTTENKNHLHDVNFFDYDITDGNIYKTRADAIAQQNGIPTSAQESLEKNNKDGDQTGIFANTIRQGINSDANYKQSGEIKLAFGNSNTGTGLGELKWRDAQNKENLLNRANNAETNPSYENSTFGLIKGVENGALNKLPVPIWNEGVNAPDLFSSADRKTEDENIRVAGKTAYIDYTDKNGEEKSWYSLGFERIGGTYTLSYVNDNKKGTKAVEDLTKFIHTAYPVGSASGSSFREEEYVHTKIFTNQFWPMDKSESYGTDFHDLKFGNYLVNGDNALYNNRHYVNPANTNNNLLPPSDDGIDHNAYFGMSFTADFSVEPGYCSPLAYWFYGDDDMWVLLSELDENDKIIESTTRLIADIGGVHGAVGEYANLWEYIKPVGFDEPAKKYRLTIFYTERGASGSTCYLRMTVPLAAQNLEPPKRNDELVFEKVLLNENGDEIKGDASNETFLFRLTLEEDGVHYKDIYDAKVFERVDSSGHGILIRERPLGLSNEQDGIYEFTLKGGQYLVVTGLPPGTNYTIEEVGTAIVHEDGTTEQISTTKYATLYQKGTHKHTFVENTDGSKTERIDETLNEEKRYSEKVLGSSSHELEAGGFEVTNNYVRFTNAPAVKTEVSPGDKKGVHVGNRPEDCEEIIYEIEWGNDAGDTASVIVTDPLDPGLDFIAAKFGGGNGVADDEWFTLRDENGAFVTQTFEDGTSIEYDQSDPNNPKVIWNMPERPAEAKGLVALKVRVNMKALQNVDMKVKNKATIDIGAKRLATNEVENPVWTPKKEETSPGKGEIVLPNNEITYKIYWKNYLDEPASITIRDPLDTKVLYKDGKAENAAAYFIDDSPLDKSSYAFSATEDDNGVQTLNWSLKDVSPGAQGYVKFTVNVKEDAPAGTIWNFGYVKVGSKPEIETNHIDNPLYIYELPSTGGVGTSVYIATGTSLIAGSFITAFIIRRTKRRKAPR